MFPTVTALLDRMDGTLPRIDTAGNAPLAGKLRIADLMTRWLRHGEQSDYHARFYGEGLALLRRLDALTGRSGSTDGVDAPIDPTERPEYFEVRVQSLFRRLVDGQDRLAELTPAEDILAFQADLAVWEYGYYADRSNPPRAATAGDQSAAQGPRLPGHDTDHAQASARSAKAAGVRVRDDALELAPLRDVPGEGTDALLQAIIHQLHIIHVTPLEAADQPASAAEGTSRWLAAWRDHMRALNIASPGANRALQWLEATLPGEDAPAGRVHGACDVDHILVATDGSVVLDGWGANHMGDPVEDLADLIVALDGRLSADAVVHACKQRIGATVPAFRLAWFTLFARVKQVIAGYGALAALEEGGVPDATALAAAVRQLRAALAAAQALAPATNLSMR